MWIDIENKVYYKMSQLYQMYLKCRLDGDTFDKWMDEMIRLKLIIKIGGKEK